MAKGKTNYPPGGVDTSDATATVADILDSKTAYGSAGTKLTGTMPNKVGSATVITPSTADQTIAKGYYGGAPGDGKVIGDANLVAEKIKSGETIFGVTGSYAGSITSRNFTATVNGVTATFWVYQVGKTYFIPVCTGFYSGKGGYVKSNSLTRAKIASLLGITIDSYVDKYVARGHHPYWNGSSWGVVVDEDCSALISITST